MWFLPIWEVSFFSEANQKASVRKSKFLPLPYTRLSWNLCNFKLLSPLPYKESITVSLPRLKSLLMFGLKTGMPRAPYKLLLLLFNLLLVYQDCSYRVEIGFTTVGLLGLI